MTDLDIVVWLLLAVMVAVMIFWLWAAQKYDEVDEWRRK